MKSTNETIVFMSEYKVLAEEGVLKTVGLGSCVGIALYDPFTLVGGLAHILLPSATEGRNINKKKPGTYADIAIEFLIHEMEKFGASISRLWAKIAGGGEMFGTFGNLPINVGSMNVSSVKTILRNKRIPLIGEDTGGNKGRTMRLDVACGLVYVLRVGDEREIEI